jgi:hypothetical protein
MLISQAHTLDAIYNDLVRRALLNMRDYFDASERLMRLALKAQSQCRTTLESLAEIKNPRSVAFVRQANIAQGGPQQVNNAPPPEPSRAREKLKPLNELLGDQPSESWLESGTTVPASRRDPEMASVGAINGPAHEGGQEPVKSDQYEARSLRPSAATSRVAVAPVNDSQTAR